MGRQKWNRRARILVAVSFRRSSEDWLVPKPGERDVATFGTTKLWAGA
jgi:hypothetical protein